MAPHSYASQEALHYPTQIAPISHSTICYHETRRSLGTNKYTVNGECLACWVYIVPTST